MTKFEQFDNNVVLIGMMGVGKTAVGRLLAEELAYDFVDMDAEMEQICGLKLSEIYRKYGQIRFYAEERLLLNKQLGSSRRIIAAGGALMPTAEQQDLWRKLGSVIWLTSDADSILRRMRRKQNRIFLPKKATVADVQQIIAARRPFYEQAAEYCVNMAKMNPEQAAAKIIAQLTADDLTTPII